MFVRPPGQMLDERRAVAPTGVAGVNRDLLDVCAAVDDVREQVRGDLSTAVDHPRPVRIDEAEQKLTRRRVIVGHHVHAKRPEGLPRRPLDLAEHAHVVRASEPEHVRDLDMRTLPLSHDFAAVERWSNGNDRRAPRGRSRTGRRAAPAPNGQVDGRAVAHADPVDLSPERPGTKVQPTTRIDPEISRRSVGALLPDVAVSSTRPA